MLRCPLCDALVAKFADSHVFPLAISREFMGGAPLARLDGSSRRPQPSRNGNYVQVVCTRCEAESQLADQEFIQFYKTLNALRPDNGQEGREIVVACDTAKLQTACVQLFYRAALSTRNEHEHIVADSNLRQRIRGALKSGRNIFKCGLEVAITHRSDGFGKAILSPPSLCKLQERFFYTFNVPTFTVAIAIGFLPKTYRAYKLRREQPPIVASFPTPEDEVAEAEKALEDAGGADTLDEFFASGRGKPFK